ncbi:hypothetical protein [Streptomyces sp. NPDC051776]|uniref:hypothetical protein n=1 Tax=Streptomyces sp. NPDC051776 TaxID=3155414 RepID=UPI00342BE39B
MAAFIASSGASAAAAEQAPARTVVRSAPDRELPAGPGTTCGTVTTAAGYPAEVRIRSGSVRCTKALRVFQRYYTALANGEAPGNGGGGPVNVRRWTCQSPSSVETEEQPTCVRGDTTIAAHVQF